jgi:hypothetical protein
LPRRAFGSGDADLGERGVPKRSFSRRGTLKPTPSGSSCPSISTIRFVPLPRLVLPTAEAPFWQVQGCRPESSLLTAIS